MRVVEALNILNVTSPDLSVIKQAFEDFTTQQFTSTSRADLCRLGSEACRALEDRLDYLQEHWTDLQEELSGYASQQPVAEVGYDGERDEAALNLIALYQERYEAVAKLEGVNMELCGTWLWCSGETRAHTTTLKALGFRWARKKQMWSWHPPTYKRRSRREWNMSEIRAEFGTQQVTGRGDKGEEE